MSNPTMSKTMKSEFMRRLERAHNGARVYAKKPTKPNDLQVLNDIKAGRFTIHKKLEDHRNYTGIFKYINVESKRKYYAACDVAEQRADKENERFSTAYYKAVDGVQYTDSAVKAAKVCSDFEAFAAKFKKQHEK
jgi:hypothetical protein